MRVRNVHSNSACAIPISGPSLRCITISMSTSFPSPDFVNRIAGRGLRSLSTTSVVVIVPAGNGLCGRTRQLTRTRHGLSNLHMRVIHTSRVCGRFSSKAPSTATCHHFVGVLCSHTIRTRSVPHCLLLFNSKL